MRHEVQPAISASALHYQGFQGPKLQNPGRFGINWLICSVLFLGFAFFVALPMMYFVPLLGMPFMFFFSDAVLLGLAAMFARIVPNASPAARLLTFLFAWITLSLATEIPRLGEHLSSSSRQANEGIRLMAPIPAPVSPAVLNIAGPANPILAARGYQWQIVPDGHTKSGGSSLANMAEVFDLADALQQRGITPRINGDGYPRLVLSRSYTDAFMLLAVGYLDKDRHTVATYTRRLPMPPVYPGHVLEVKAKLAASVFYFNFWRGVLGVNRTVDIDKEVDQFLNALFGPEPASRRIFDAPMRTLVAENDMVNQVPKGTTVTQFFANPGSTEKATSTGETFHEVCGRRIMNVAFGEPGGSPTVGAFTGGFISAALIHHVSPDDGVFSYYCDMPRRRIIAFAHFGTEKKPGLRLSVFDLSGQLQDVLFFRIPQLIEPGTIVEPGSVAVDDVGNTRFTMLKKMRSMSANHQQIDNQRQYRSWTFSFDTSTDQVAADASIHSTNPQLPKK